MILPSRSGADLTDRLAERLDWRDLVLDGSELAAIFIFLLGLNRMPS
jgi:hypothetical protein